MKHYKKLFKYATLYQKA